MLHAVEKLLAEKAAGVELADLVLHGFLARKIERLEKSVAAIEPPPPDEVERLNRVFRRVLREAWS